MVAYAILVDTTSKVRRHIVARASALCLIALIVCPFTAPFATCNLSHGHHDELFKDKTGTDSVLLVAPVLSAWLPDAPRSLVILPLGTFLVVRFAPHDTVLRL